jgi:hypothetical protein
MSKTHMQKKFSWLIHPRALCNIFKTPGHSTEVKSNVTCKKCLKILKKGKTNE